MRGYRGILKNIPQNYDQTIISSEYYVIINYVWNARFEFILFIWIAKTASLGQDAL